MIHSFLMMVSFFGAIGAFTAGLILKIVPLWAAAIGYFFLYPIIFEMILNLKAFCCRSRMKSHHNCKKSLVDKFPFVYSPGYNISFCGLERLHPFDAQKYRRVFEGLKEKGVIDDRTQIHSPSLPTREFLLEQMTWQYLFKLNYSFYICKCLEVPLFFMPAFLLRIKALEPMQRATQGSVDASCIALHKRWAINLAGGYHHACRTHGGGFCIYPDITFIVHYARLHHGIKRVMIIDLDAHQGNGHERDFINDKEVHIVDGFNPGIYPGDSYALEGISTQIYVSGNDDDQAYISKLQDQIPSAFESFKPELIVYNAGSDCMKGDPLGQMNLSSKCISDRDELMFKYALEDYNVPIVMVLSGGYQFSNAPAIADSIENLVQRFSLKPKDGTA